ncbi:MAG: hypothetical protein LBG79_03850, partial [Spirochaetaceae bacterium]|nr:hypothetical protein [Spirochaetaceae bacterium]
MRIGFAISAVLALAACGIEYNPSFARLKMADSEPEGYGSFEWDISFPPNTVKPGKVSFTLKREPGDLSVLSLGSDWIDLTSGQAAGRQDNIPAGAYFLDLHLGADFAYVSTHRVVSIKKDETSSLNLNFVTTDFIAYTLLNVKFTLKSEAPLTPDLTKITFHEADDCADSAFMSYNGGTDERSVSTNSLTTEYESIAWTAVPNN